MCFIQVAVYPWIDFYQLLLILDKYAILSIYLSIRGNWFRALLTVFIGHDVSFLSAFLYNQTWTLCIYPLATMTIVVHYRKQIRKLIFLWKNTAIVHPSLY
jgi:hypothetical protein